MFERTCIHVFFFMQMLNFILRSVILISGQITIKIFDTKT